MTRDLIIGILISLALHGTFLFAFNKKEGPKNTGPAKKEEVIMMEMPPLPEEEPEEVEEIMEEDVTNQLAPPSLVDVPSVNVTAFTQPLQPPPPPGLTAAAGAITIPVIKPGTKLGQGMKDLFDVANLDQPPVLRVPVNPNYPFEMRRAGISGEVLVEFIVNSNGDVSQIAVVRSSQREFEQPALQAVMKWKFRPGKKGGRNVNTRVQQVITFNLNDE